MRGPPTARPERLGLTRTGSAIVVAALGLLCAAAILLPAGAAAGQSSQATSAPFAQLATGIYHSCAVLGLDNGSVRCWGFALDGQLGLGNRTAIGDNESPGSVGPVDLGAGRTATAITAGNRHTPARCWTAATCAAGAWARPGSSATAQPQYHPVPEPVRAGRLRARPRRAGDHGRWRPHLRHPRRRQRALLGLQHQRPARLRQDDRRPVPGRGRTRRPRRRPNREGDHRRRLAHVRGARRRQRSLLGPQRRGAARPL